MNRPWRYGPAFRISLTYLLLSILWIALSDTAVRMLFQDDMNDLRQQVETFKGMGFVVLTALILYWLVFRAWQTQQESDLKYRELFYANPHPMWIYDADTFRFLAVNEAAIRKYGYSRDEFLNMSIVDIRPPAETEQLLEVLRTQSRAPGTLMDTKRIWTHCRKDGTLIQVQVISSVMLWEGRIARVVHAYDVTDQLAAKNALQAQKDMLQSIFDYIPVMIAVFDDMGGKLVNREWEQVTGWTQTDIEGTQLLRQMYTDKQERIRAAKFIEAARPAVWEEFKFLNKAGAIIDAAWTTVKLDERTRIALGQDITERKRAEAARREAEWLLTELQKEKELREMKNRFTAMVAHELRTPLTVIQNTSEILNRYAEKLDTTEKNTYFERIGKSVAHISKMTEQMMTINRLGARQVQFNAVRVNLVHFCRQMLSLFQEMPDEVHQFVFTYAGNNEEEISVDTEFLNHILTNLLSNAVKYSPDGGEVRLDVTLTEENMIFKVADQGIGIPELDLPYVFEPFRRAENVGQIRGSGLGLAIVKDYVELYGGTIAVTSAEGQGTVFTVTLPKVPPQPNTLSSSPATSNPA